MIDRLKNNYVTDITEDQSDCSLYPTSRKLFLYPLQASFIDAYGIVAQSLLEPLQSDFIPLAQEVTEKLYSYIQNEDKLAAIINRVRPRTFNRLKQHEAQYLTKLLSHDLAHSTHIDVAQKAGRRHALLGIEISWLVEAINFYQNQINRLLIEHISDLEVREEINSVISQRFLREIEGQTSSYKQISTEVTTAFSRINREVMSSNNLTDLIRSSLKIIGTLPGGTSVLFARMNKEGLLQTEQSYFNSTQQHKYRMASDDAPKIRIDTIDTAGQEPGNLAWRSGKIIVSDSWLFKSDKILWQETANDSGLRSCAAVPILDDLGRSIALLCLYSEWPGYFSNDNISGFLNHVQHLLSYGIQHLIHAPLVPLREQHAYRALLADGSVVMNYQPIINLKDGSLSKIEGLARLKNHAGELVAPKQFLPALGEDELLRLFELGITQICQDMHKLCSQGIDTKISLNLPAEGLGDPRYEKTFFDCLRKYDLKPDRFQVEVLETQEVGERIDEHKDFIKRFQAAGVQVSQDDLGAGHSSLLRLDQYPFDEVKIDQRLVKGALQNPKRAIGFILHLTRLAHAFNTPVTVEGLENIGLIEAATILGADSGQGYGIARPMSLDRFISWYQNFTFSIDPMKPKTAIGALAGYLLWDMQIMSIYDQPELEKHINGKLIVEQYIDRNSLHGSRLERLLNHSIKLVASSDDRLQKTTNTRERFIRELTNHWIKEAKDCN